jgi:hypothetical protein
MKLKTLTEASGRAVDTLLMNGHNPRHTVTPVGESPAQLAAAAKVLRLLDAMPPDGPNDLEPSSHGDFPPYLAERTVERIEKHAKVSEIVTSPSAGEFS